MARKPLTTVSVFIVDSTPLFVRGGDVYDWTEKLARQIQRASVELCPPNHTNRRATTRYVNSRRLMRHIHSRTRMDGTRLDEGMVFVSATIDPDDKNGTDYSDMVLGGTGYQGTRYIYSNRGFANKAIIDAVISRRGVRVLGLGQVTASDLQGNWVMRFRSDGGRHFRVHGQKRQPFLMQAFNRVSRRHGSALGEFGVPWV